MVLLAARWLYATVAVTPQLLATRRANLLEGAVTLLQTKW